MEISIACLHTYGPDIDGQLHKTMIHAMKRRMLGLQNSDLRFISLFAGNARNVRTIMAFVFYELYQSDHMQGKERLARIYLKMIETISNPQQSWGESCTLVAVSGVAK